MRTALSSSLSTRSITSPDTGRQGASRLRFRRSIAPESPEPVDSRSKGVELVGAAAAVDSSGGLDVKALVASGAPSTCSSRGPAASSEHEVNGAGAVSDSMRDGEHTCTGDTCTGDGLCPPWASLDAT